MAQAKKKKMAVLFLDGIVLLPNMTIQVEVKDDMFAKDAINESMSKNQPVFITSKIDSKYGVSMDNINVIGVVSNINSVTRGLPDGKIKIGIRGIVRGEVKKIYDEDRFFAVDVTPIIEDDLSALSEDEKIVVSTEYEAMSRQLFDMLLGFGKSVSKSFNNIDKPFKYTESLSELIDNIAGTLPLREEDRRKVLLETDIRSRFFVLTEILKRETEINRIKSELSNKVKSQVEKNQKDYVLREQLKTIKRELGFDKEDSEIEEYRSRLEALEASDEVKAKIEKEIVRCERERADSSEGNVQRNYIETLLDMPWDKKSDDNLDLKKAEEILERDHYGLEKVKERVLEFLSVRALTTKGDSPIMCLVGPPGTGKTSIARSVAEALNREYVRISLGGVRDEAEIRGHRRTYVGAMPGRIANGIKSAGVKNPLIVLDEIDKASRDVQGDTSAALLEVLDSEQNSKFRDRYLDIPLDLSEVLFLATANDKTSIPRPLLDRMEIIDISGYTQNEKFHIAKDYLIKKQYEKNGIKTSALKISDEAIECIIKNYTRESGVRGLERNIGKICRKAAKLIVMDDKKTVRVSGRNLKDFLGVEKYRIDLKNKKDEIGIVRGLAWTQVGGDTLQIEVNIMPGKGEIILTGQMGDVMKESAQIGLSYIRSIQKKTGKSAEFFKENDFHIHIPEGAVPKDGPSAGITMATALYSAITNEKVRADLAMTGEITLRGRVLPIGGLKEKLLAAKVAGMNTVLVPFDNKPNVEEIDAEIKDGLEITFVKTMDEVLRRAIV